MCLCNLKHALHFWVVHILNKLDGKAHKVLRIKDERNVCLDSIRLLCKWFALRNHVTLIKLNLKWYYFGGRNAHHYIWKMFWEQIWWSFQAQHYIINSSLRSICIIIRINIMSSLSIMLPLFSSIFYSFCRCSINYCMH